MLLSIFYIFNALAFSIPALFLLIQTHPLSLFLYEMSLFLISLSSGFLIMFSYNLIISPKTSPWWKMIVILPILAFPVRLSFFIPNGVRYDSNTNWVPVYSWSFFAYLTILLTMTIVIPQIYFSLKNYRKITDKALKRKLKLFLIGILMLSANIYCTAL